MITVEQLSLGVGAIGGTAIWINNVIGLFAAVSEPGR